MNVRVESFFETFLGYTPRVPSFSEYPRTDKDKCLVGCLISGCGLRGPGTAFTVTNAVTRGELMGREKPWDEVQMDFCERERAPGHTPAGHTSFFLATPPSV